MHQGRKPKEIGPKLHRVLPWCKNACYASANFFWGLRVNFYFLTPYQECKQNQQHLLSLKTYLRSNMLEISR